MGEAGKEDPKITEQSPYFIEPVGKTGLPNIDVKVRGFWGQCLKNWYDEMEKIGILSAGIAIPAVLEKIKIELGQVSFWEQTVNRRRFLKGALVVSTGAALGTLSLPRILERLARKPEYFWKTKTLEQNPLGCGLVKFINITGEHFLGYRKEKKLDLQLGEEKKSDSTAGRLYQMPVLWPEKTGAEKEVFDAFGNKVFVFVADPRYRTKIKLASEEKTGAVSIAPTIIGLGDERVGAVAHFTACAPQVIALAERVEAENINSIDPANLAALSIVYGCSSLAVTKDVINNPYIWKHAQSRLLKPPEIFPELAPSDSPAKKGLLMMEDGQMRLIGLTQIKKIVAQRKLPEGVSGLFLNQFGFSGETLETMESLDIPFGENYHRTLNLVGQLKDGRTIFVFASWNLTLTPAEYPNIIREALAKSGIICDQVSGLWCMDLGLATGLMIRDGVKLVSPAHLNDIHTKNKPGGNLGLSHTNAGILCLEKRI